MKLKLVGKRIEGGRGRFGVRAPPVQPDDVERRIGWTPKIMKEEGAQSVEAIVPTEEEVDTQEVLKDLMHGLAMVVE